MIALLLAAAAALPQSAGELQQLELRDRVLLNHPWGRAFVASYYQLTLLAALPLELPEERPVKPFGEGAHRAELEVSQRVAGADF